MNKLYTYGIALSAALSSLNCGGNTETYQSDQILDAGNASDTIINDAKNDIHDAVLETANDSNDATPCELIEGVEPNGISFSSNPYNPTKKSDAGYPFADHLKCTVHLVHDAAISTFVSQGNDIVRYIGPENEFWQVGTLETYFDGKDNNGHLLAPGSYKFTVSAVDGNCADIAMSNFEIDY